MRRKPTAKDREEARGKLGRSEVEENKALALERERLTRRAEKAEFLAAIKQLEERVELAEARQLFLDRLSEAPDPRPLEVKAIQSKGSLPEATYVMLASDWHVGERVDATHVQGKNEYSPEIARERAERFWRSNLTMIRAARSAWNVNQALLWLGGDLITGYIHEEYMEDNFLSPIEEALLARELLVSGIKFVLDEYEVDRLWVLTSNGNHGRTGKKKVSSYAKNSFEWMLYHLLAAEFASEPRVDFQVANGYHNVASLYGFRVAFSHGDALRFSGGVGGVTIPGNKRIGRAALSLPIEWEGTLLDKPHLHVWGHYHELMYPKTFIQNGSLIGWNDFAEWLGCTYERPQQASFVVDSRHRAVSNFNPIFVTKPSK